MQKQTKIVCTIGPASENKETLKKMAQAGMNVCRLNFSHGTYDHHKILIDNIRAVSKELNHPLTIMADLQGPRIRTGVLPAGGVPVAAGESVTLTTATEEFKDNKIPVTYSGLHKEVKPGERVLIDDALIALKIISIENSDIVCEVVQPGTITTHRGMNFPDSSLTISPITEKDKEDLAFAVENEVDWIALSFVSGAKDILNLKQLIKNTAKSTGQSAPILTIAKVERRDAVKNIEEIIDAADSIMVARGDLGIELPPADVPLHQKKMVDMCLAAAKPVIIATQMLDSMARNPRPTRAEVSDVANAVIDHTDAVMLSAESATGKYPLETVQTMTDIITKTENSEYDDLVLDHLIKTLPIDEAVSQVANVLAASVGAKLILVASMSGYTARIVCRYRPELPIYVTTNNERVQRQLNLSWGVIPFLLPTCNTVEELINSALEYLKNNEAAATGDRIIVIAGDPVGQSGVNLVEIREVK